MFSKNEIIEIKDYLSTLSDTSKIYLGADSQTFNRGNGLRVAVFTCVLVVHKNGCNGCKIFGYSEDQKDYDQKLNKPSQRLMTEAYKVANLFNEIEDLILEYDIEIHLDVNSKKEFASNAVVKSAMGYILGTCGIEAKIKPDAWAASYAADRIVKGRLSTIKK